MSNFTEIRPVDADRLADMRKLAGGTGEHVCQHKIQPVVRLSCNSRPADKIQEGWEIKNIKIRLEKKPRAKRCIKSPINRGNTPLAPSW